jgi:hypothetical protein
MTAGPVRRIVPYVEVTTLIGGSHVRVPQSRPAYLPTRRAAALSPDDVTSVSTTGIAMSGPLYRLQKR